MFRVGPMEPGSAGKLLDNVWSFDWTTKMWSEEKGKLSFLVSRHAVATVGDGVVIIHTYKGVITFKDGILPEQTNNGDVPDLLSMYDIFWRIG